MTKQTRKHGLAILGGVLVALVALLAVTGIYFLQQNTFSKQEWDDLHTAGTYHDGITIDGISVGGMTMAQARAAVEKDLRARMDVVRVTLEHGDQIFVLEKSDFDIADNMEQVLEDALRVAREGSRVDVQKQIEDINENGMAFTTDYTVDPSPAKVRLEQIANGLYALPQDATLQINKDDRENRFTYTDEISGTEVDVEALYAAVAEQIRLRQYGTVSIPFREVPATVTKASLQAGTALCVKASTSFAKSPYNRDSRVSNIKKAVGIINGYVLAPGEAFSTNTVLGPRTYALGWEPAPAIVRGGSEDQAGGGVCQVSTTMYTAVLKADLEIVDRRGHSIQLGYVDGGLDATINTDTIDFVYKNNTTENVYIFCWVDSSEKKVRFEIYRMSFSGDYDEIKLSSEKVETLRPDGEMLVTVDLTKAPGYKEQVIGRRDGAVYKTYKHFYKNGSEVGSSELVARTTYKAYAGEMIIGPEPVPTPTPQPEPTPPPQPETPPAPPVESGETE